MFSEHLGSSEWQPSPERFGTEASKPQRTELRCGRQSCGKWTTQALGILWLFSLHDLVFPQTSAFLRFRLASRTRTPGHRLRTKSQCFTHLDRQWCPPTHPQRTHPRGSSRPGTPSLSARYSPLSKDSSENHIWRAGVCALVGKGGGGRCHPVCLLWSLRASTLLESPPGHLRLKEPGSEDSPGVLGWPRPNSSIYTLRLREASSQQGGATSGNPRTAQTAKQPTLSLGL